MLLTGTVENFLQKIDIKVGGNALWWEKMH
jgi:hypothetical protein